MLASPHRYASHLSEDRSQRPEEPFLLHQEVALDVLSSGVELSYQEVPVAGVWCKTDDVLLGKVDGYFLLPSHSLV